MRARLSPRQRRGRRGFSLIEILIVIAILGITFALAMAGLNSAFKRQRLGSKAEELKTLAGRTLTEMQDRNVRSFLVVGKYLAGIGTAAAVVTDTNGNGTWDITQDATTGDFLDNGDRVAWRVRIPPDIALSTTALATQSFNSQWFRPASTEAVSAALVCDFMGRATRPAVGAPMITGPATVQLTHAEMVSGSLKPMVTYTVSVGPLFKSSLTRITTGE